MKSKYSFGCLALCFRHSQLEQDDQRNEAGPSLLTVDMASQREHEFEERMMLAALAPSIAPSVHSQLSKVRELEIWSFKPVIHLRTLTW